MAAAADDSERGYRAGDRVKFPNDMHGLFPGRWSHGTVTKVPYKLGGRWWVTVALDDSESSHGFQLSGPRALNEDLVLLDSEDNVQ